MKLTEFLLARIAEDEAAAQAATPGPWVEYDCADATFNSDDGRGWWWVWRQEALPHFGGVIEATSRTPNCVIGECRATDARNGDKERDDAKHIARWDPARVIAECEAKRQFVAAVIDVPLWPNEKSALAADRAVKTFALPYSDHPDYDEAWRP